MPEPGCFPLLHIASWAIGRVSWGRGCLGRDLQQGFGLATCQAAHGQDGGLVLSPVSGWGEATAPRPASGRESHLRQSLVVPLPGPHSGRGWEAWLHMPSASKPAPRPRALQGPAMEGLLEVKNRHPKDSAPLLLTSCASRKLLFAPQFQVRWKC